MNLPAFCIKRPVFTLVVNGIIMLLGALFYQQISVRGLPAIAFPQVGVHVELAGASPSLMENSVTIPIENALQQITGVDHVESNSRYGVSDVNLYFTSQTNVDQKVNEIRNMVARIQPSLPNGISKLDINPADPNADPTMMLALSDSSRKLIDLSHYVDTNLLPQIQTIDGIAQVRVMGAQDYIMRIQLSPKRMAAHHVTVADINTALQTQNTHAPGGQLHRPGRDYTILIKSRLSTATQFENIIIRSDNGQVVRLRNVANVKVTAKAPDEFARFNGKPAVGIGIIPASNANPLAVSRAVSQLLTTLKQHLPKGMQLHVAYDTSQFIASGIHHVFETLYIAIALVVLVVFIFLGGVRQALIPIVTIPICLIGCFTFLYIIGQSINTISLLALVLAVGLVVDDAIIILENVYRYIHQGLTPLAAALKGSRELVFVIIATTITLAAVYLPVSFASGLTGSLLRAFGLTLTITVIISGFVALSLSPMLCAHMLPDKAHESRFSTGFNALFMRFEQAYERLLTACLKRHRFILSSVPIILILAYVLLLNLPQSLVPNEDRGMIIADISGPSNASLHYTQRYANKMATSLRQLPEANNVMLTIGKPTSAQGQAVLSLNAWDKRERSSQGIMDTLTKQLTTINGVRIALNPPPFIRIPGLDGPPLQIAIMSSGSYQQLQTVADQLVARLQKYPGINSVNQSLSFDSLNFNFNINRELAAVLGVNISDITETISTLLNGQVESQFAQGGQSYDVIAKMPDAAINNPNIIDQLYERTANGTMTALSNLVTVDQAVLPLELNRYNRLRADTISAQINSGYDLGQVIHDVSRLVTQQLPSGYSFAFTGQAKNFLQSQHVLRNAFLLALLFIYLVLAAQFESFVDPIIILITVPLSLAGALLALTLTGNSLNIYSIIGLITLIGLIAKHGILITEVANHLQQQGLDKLSAVRDACCRRLRPILMTTMATIFGALPLAFAYGPSAETHHQIGWTVVGGMLLGTCLSLFVLPSFYLLLAKTQPKLGAEERT